MEMTMSDSATVVDRIDARLADTDRDALIAARADIVRLHDKLRVRSKLLVDIFNSDEGMALSDDLKSRIEACTSGRV
jgi:hypothetical protein